MNITTNFNQIFFQKQLKAKAKTDDNGLELKIYQLDKKDPDDLSYFKNLQKSSFWNGGRFARNMDENINSSNPCNDDRYFVLENNQGDCFGIIETMGAFKNTDNIEYFATYNGAKNADETKKVKNLGRILLTYVIQLAKKEDRDLIIAEPFKSAVPFYKKFGFRYETGERGFLKLKTAQMDEAIEQNASKGIDLKYV